MKNSINEDDILKRFKQEIITRDSVKDVVEDLRLLLVDAFYQPNILRWKDDSFKLVSTRAEYFSYNVIPIKNKYKLTLCLSNYDFKEKDIKVYVHFTKSKDILYTIEFLLNVEEVEISMKKVYYTKDKETREI